MKNPFRHRPECWLAGAAVVALLASTLGVVLAHERSRRPRRASSMEGIAAPTYVPVTLVRTEEVKPPSAANAFGVAGRSSGFDLFTAPLIQFDPKSGRYRTVAAQSASQFPYRLVDLKRDAYPVQLAGYFGEPGAYSAGFAVAGSPQLRFCRPGELIRDGLRLVRFSTNADGVAEPHAKAELLEETTGNQVVLDSRAATFSDGVSVILSRVDNDSGRLTVRLGDEIVVDGSTYRIDDVNPAAGEVTLTSVAQALRPSRSHTLRLSDPVAPPSETQAPLGPVSSAPAVTSAR